MISDQADTIALVPNDKGYPLRMPAAVYDALKRAAEADGRSMNNLILKVLTDWLRKGGFLK